MVHLELGIFYPGGIFCPSSRASYQNQDLNMIFNVLYNFTASFSWGWMHKVHFCMYHMFNDVCTENSKLSSSSLPLLNVLLFTSIYILA